MEQQAIERFYRSIEAKMAVGERIAPALADAARLIFGSLVATGKVFVVGSGRAAPLAAIFTDNLVEGFRLERPSLPALTLSGDSGNQLRALASPADVLVAISARGHSAQLLATIATAHASGMGVIALTGADDDALAAALAPTDVELPAANDDQTLTLETQLLALFCLGELIEQQLFGGHDSW